MNNLPMKIKEGIFYKLKRFFINLFKKNTEIYAVTQETVENTEMNYNKEKKKDEFKETLQKDLKEQKDKLDILSKIKNNPSLIYNLPDERLRQLIRIYDEEIEKMLRKNLNLKFN